MRWFVLPFFIFAASALSGASFSSIAESAAAVSLEAEGARLRHDAGMISIEQSELDDNPSYSISLSLEPLEEDAEIAAVSDLSFAVHLPDDDTSIEASVPFSVRYDGRGGLVSPSASVSHIFDWGRSDDMLEDLQTASSRLSVERVYESDLLSLRMSVISAVSSILSNDRDRTEEEEDLRDLERTLSEALSLGDITEDSILYRESMLQIERSENAISILDRERDELVTRFGNLTGMEWDGVEDIPYPEFPDILSVTTSSALEEADLYARIAEEEYLLEESEQNPSRLTVGAEAGGSIYLGSGLMVSGMREEDSVNVSGSVGWEGREWSVSLSGGGRWNDDHSFSPSLSVGGTWQSRPSSRSDELMLSSLRNEAILRRSEYLSELRAFGEESGELWNRILSWERSMAELEAEMDYRKALLDSLRIRLERGLAIEEDVHDAEVELRLASMDMDLLLLEGLQLEAECSVHIL